MDCLLGQLQPPVGDHLYVCAFVQQNTGSLDSNVVTELTAPEGGVAYSRFGHAIAPLGDLDDDGFDGA